MIREKHGIARISREKDGIAGIGGKTQEHGYILNFLAKSGRLRIVLPICGTGNWEFVTPDSWPPPSAEELI